MIQLVVGGAIYLVSVASATLVGAVTGGIQAGVSQHQKTTEALQRASQRAEATKMVRAFEEKYPEVRRD